MEYVLSLISIAGFQGLLALSAYLTIVTGQLSLGQQGFYAIGAYVAGIATAVWGWPLLPALILGAALATLLGVLVGFPALRVKGLYLVIATFAFGEMVRLFFLNLQYFTVKDGLRVGPLGPEGFRHIVYFYQRGFTPERVAGVILLLLALVVLVLGWIDRSRLGAVMRAVGEDELAAAMVGVNVTAVKVLAFALGAAVAGLAGGLYAHYSTFVSPDSFGVLTGTLAIAYVLVGGSAHVLGPLVGVAFFMVLTEGLRFIGDLRTFLLGAFVILAMNLRPQGLVDPFAVRRLRGWWSRERRAVRAAG